MNNDLSKLPVPSGQNPMPSGNIPVPSGHNPGAVPPPFDPTLLKDDPRVASGKKKRGNRLAVTLSIVAGTLVVGGGIALAVWWLNRDYKVTPSALTLESEGGEVRFHVEGPGGWEVQSTPRSWVYLSKQGDYLVCSASENNDFERRDTIRIGNGRKSCRVVLVQESGAFVATPSVQDVPPGGGTFRYAIGGQEGWRIEQGPEGWGSAFREENYLVWTVDENHGDRRSDYVVLRNGNKTLMVGLNQEAALRASQTSLTAGGSEHTSYITITGPHDWSCRSTSYWLDVEREGDRIKLDFDKNDESERRECEVVVTGGVQEFRISVTQNKYSSGGGYYFNPYWGW